MSLQTFNHSYCYSNGAAAVAAAAVNTTNKKYPFNGFPFNSTNDLDL